MKYSYWIGMLSLLPLTAALAATCSGPTLTDAMYTSIATTTTKAQLDALVGATGLEHAKSAKFVNGAYDFNQVDSTTYQWSGANGSLWVAFDASGNATNRSRELTTATGTFTNAQYAAIGATFSKAQIDSLLGTSGYEYSKQLQGSVGYTSYRWGLNPYVSASFDTSGLYFTGLSGSAVVFTPVSTTLTSAMVNGFSGKTLTEIETLLGKPGQLTGVNYVAGVEQMRVYSWQDSTGNQASLYVIPQTSAASFGLFMAKTGNRIGAVTRAQYDNITMGMAESALPAVFGLSAATTSNFGSYQFDDAAGNVAYAMVNGGKVISKTLSLVCGTGSSTGGSSFSITGAASGPNSSTTLTANISVAAADSGLAGSLYVVALVPGGALYALSSGAWQPVTATIPAHSNVTLGSHQISILSGLDVSGMLGLQIYAGYGKDVSDMIAGSKFAKVHEVR